MIGSLELDPRDAEEPPPRPKTISAIPAAMRSAFIVFTCRVRGKTANVVSTADPFYQLFS
jgi:hypothetical protein